MNETIINILEKPELDNPIFIEALPGIGHVGKLVADHIIEELNGTKWVEIYCPEFPPQVLVNEDGVIEPMINELYYLKDVGESKQDYIFLVGNTQALSPEGQYGLCSQILDLVEDYNISKIFTLGGLATGQPVESAKVFGSVTDIELIDELKDIGVTIRSADGGIIGASGLLLGLGKLRGIDGVCLMGETPGYFIDAEAAEALLLILLKLTDLVVDIEKLEERAEETRKMITKAQQMEQEMMQRTNMSPAEDDLRYIG